MLSPTDLKNLVIRPVLSDLSRAGRGLLSESAVNLVLGTIIHESVTGNIQHLAQIGGGPARGIGEIEPVTGHDIYDRWLALPANAALRMIVGSMTTHEPFERQLVTNLSLSVCLIRLKYYPSALPLPAPTDAVGLTRYWKIVYNTELGAGRIDADTVAAFQSAINA